MKRVLLILLLLSEFGLAVDKYFASASAGLNDGSSCVNAFAYNDGTNGLNTATNNKWVAGNILHLCGTIASALNTTAISAQGSGSIGSPITLIFETGAIVQSPAFPPETGSASCGGGICAQGRTFIVIDGGTNGIVQNSANGTALANHQTSLGIDVHNCSNCTVKNLTVKNIYVRTLATDTAIDETLMSCIATSGSNTLVTNNTFDKAGWCLKDSYQSGDTAIEWSFNHFTNTAHSMMFAAASATPATNILIHDNDFGGPGTTWDGAGCPFHQDGLHVFGVTGSTIDNFYFYNNYFHGDWGACPTGWVFIEAAGSGTPANMLNSYWWNNLGIVNTVGQIINTNGWFNVSAGNSGVQKIFNNTFIGPNNTDNTLCLNLQNLSAVSVENNVISNCGDPIQISSSTLGTLNNNLYGPSCGNGGNCFVWNGSFAGSFAAWKTATGQDASAVQSNSPALNSDGTLQSTSPARSLGANLTTSCSGSLVGLCSDKNGVARPNAAWDAGALQFSSTPATAVAPAASMFAMLK